MRDPGRDRREWQTEWEQLEPHVIDSPAETLPELDTLIEEMMVDRGFPVGEGDVREGAAPDVVADFLAAREVARRVERGETVDPGDVGNAVGAYRNLFEYLLDRGPGSGSSLGMEES